MGKEISNFVSRLNHPYNSYGPAIRENTSCKSCSHFNPSASICKLKKDKPVKPYNTCGYHYETNT